VALNVLSLSTSNRVCFGNSIVVIVVRQPIPWLFVDCWLNYMHLSFKYFWKTFSSLLILCIWKLSRLLMEVRYFIGSMWTRKYGLCNTNHRKRRDHLTGCIGYSQINGSLMSIWKPAWTSMLDTTQAKTIRNSLWKVICKPLSTHEIDWHCK
jgi:hypothetical protein